MNNFIFSNSFHLRNIIQPLLPFPNHKGYSLTQQRAVTDQPQAER